MSGLVMTLSTIWYAAMSERLRTDGDSGSGSVCMQCQEKKGEEKKNPKLSDLLFRGFL